MADNLDKKLGQKSAGAKPSTLSNAVVLPFRGPDSDVDNETIAKLKNELRDKLAETNLILEEAQNKRDMALKVIDRCQKACDLKSLDQMIKERDAIKKELFEEG